MFASRPFPLAGVVNMARLASVLALSVMVVSCSRIDPSSSAADPSLPASSTSTTTAASAQSTTTVVEVTTGDDTTPTSLEVTTTLAAPIGVEVLEPEIVNTFPHDPLAFTQGLEFHGDLLVESIGEYGRSARRIVDPTTGAITAEVALPLEQFGNGLTISNDRLIQLTWKAGRAIIADPATLETIGQFDLEGEGWGICAEDDRIITSNGSNRLTFRDPVTFVPIGTIDVTFDGQAVSNLNELECVDGLLWANRWLTTEILRIDPATGAVTGIVDARSLVPADQTLGQEDVLNGIAFRANTDTFFVTGKRWNTLYEVRFVPAN